MLIGNSNYERLLYINSFESHETSHGQKPSYNLGVSTSRVYCPAVNQNYNLLSRLVF